MWQAHNQRSRAQASAKKREKDRARRALHIKRLEVQLQLIEKEPEQPDKLPVRMFLNDFSTKGIGVFANQSLPIGQAVSLTLQEPIEVTLKGRIIWCQEHDGDSHILTQKPFSFRLGIEFEFASPAEEEQAQKYYDEIKKTCIMAA